MSDNKDDRPIPTSNTDFHAIRTHIDHEMLTGLIPDFRLNSVYAAITTTVEPLKIISLSKDGLTIIVKDHNERSNAEPIFIKTTHTRTIRRIAIWEDPKKPLIVTASNDGTSEVYEYTGRLLRKCTGHRGKINCIMITKGTPLEKTIIITGGEDKTVRCWNLKTGQMRKLCGSHDYPIAALAFCSGRGGEKFKELFASYDTYGQIKLWDYDECELQRILNAYPPERPLLKSKK